MSLPPSWNPGTDKLLREWKNQLLTKRKAHNVASKKATHKGYAFSIGIFIIGVFQNTFQIAFFGSSSSTISSDKAMVVAITLAVIGYMSTGLSQAKDFMNFHAKATSHDSAANECTRLVNFIDIVLRLSYPERIAEWGSPLRVLRELMDSLRTLNQDYESLSEGNEVEFAAPSSAPLNRPKLTPIQPSEVEDSIDPETLRLGRLALEGSEPPKEGENKISIGFNLEECSYDYTNLRHQLDMLNLNTPTESPPKARRKKKLKKLEEVQEEPPV